MASVISAVIDRTTALFAASAALDLETECAARHAACQAELLRLAGRYAAEGLHDVAARLRRQADEAGPQRPLAGVLPDLSHLAAATAGPASAPPAPAPVPAGAGDAAHAGPARLPAVRNGRKGGR